MTDKKTFIKEKAAEIWREIACGCNIPDTEELIEELLDEWRAQQASGAEPVGEWVKAEGGDYPQLQWRIGYRAEIGDKLYTAPQPPKAVPDDLAVMVIDSMPSLIDACGNSYVNTWLQSHLETARKYGFWSGPVIGDKENILSSVDSYLSHPGPSTTAFDDQEAPDE